jgi:hypothetical protein
MLALIISSSQEFFWAEVEVFSMSNKITAEKLIEDRRGIDALLKEAERLNVDDYDV